MPGEYGTSPYGITSPYGATASGVTLDPPTMMGLAGTTTETTSLSGTVEEITEAASYLRTGRQ